MFWTLGAIIALAGVPLYAIWKANRAERRYPPVGEFVQVEGVCLHYVRKGQGDPVVLLHGSDGFLQDFTLTVFDRLASDYDVIALDRPGHGYSGLPQKQVLTPLAQAHLLHSALKTLGITHPILVGHSWSGLLLMIYALEYPEAVGGLVLLAPWVYPPHRRPALLMRLPLLPGLGAFFAATLLTPVKNGLIRLSLAQAFAPAPIPRPYAALAQALWQRWPYQTVAFAQENTTDRDAMRRYSPRYREVHLPVIIVTGDSDQMVKADVHAYRLHTELPDSQLVRLPQTGHALLFCAPDVVIEAVRQCHGRIVSGLAEGASLSAAADRPASLDAPTTKSRLERARDLIFRYGWNATAYQILNPEIEHWFSQDGEAVVGFVRRYRVRIVAGAPVCEARRLAEVAAEFERTAQRAGERVCYFGAATRLRTALEALPMHTSVVIGAQPYWNPVHWKAIMERHSSLRGQRNRARNKGIETAEWSPQRAAGNLDLQRCLDEWLASHPFPRLHFLTEPVSLNRLADRRLFVADSAGTPVAYLLITPIPDRNGWLIEQIVRGKDAPNGTAEFLIDSVMQCLAEEGADYVTLGLAPLSRRATTADPQLPWLRLLLHWVRAHGKRFYNFDGLDAFKAKFKPDGWEPIYAISNETRFSFHTLYALIAAFSEGSPARAVLHALITAVQQEFAWLRQKRSTTN